MHFDEASKLKIFFTDRFHEEGHLVPLNTLPQFFFLVRLWGLLDLSLDLTLRTLKCVIHKPIGGLVARLGYSLRTLLV